MKKRVLILALLFSLLEAKDFNFLLNTSYGVGGDEVVFIYNNRNLDAGDGLSYEIGTIFKTLEDNEHFDTSLTVGYIYNGTFFQSDTPFISTIPISVMEYYTFDNNIKVGAGVTYHAAHKLHGSSTVPSLTFDNAVGGVFSLGYSYGEGRKQHVSFQTTVIDYKIANTTLNGNRYAIVLGAAY